MQRGRCIEGQDRKVLGVHHYEASLNTNGWRVGFWAWRLDSHWRLLYSSFKGASADSQLGATYDGMLAIKLSRHMGQVV